MRFSWEKIELPSNTSTPDHLRLDYLIPEGGKGWHVIADSIPWTDNEYTWIAPDSLLVGDQRYFRLAVMDSAKEILNADYRRFEVLETTDVATERASVSMIQGVWPNPSAGGARIKYVLPAPAEVRVEVFDVAGRHVRTVTEGKQPPGTRTIDWDGRNDAGHRAASGMYFIRLSLGTQTETERLVLVE